MKKGEKLHDFFYEAVRKASDHNIGRKALNAVAPIIKMILPRERATRSAEEIFKELGYQPDIFNSSLSAPVRVFEHNLKGVLSFCAHYDVSLTSKVFSDKISAWAIMSYKGPSNTKTEANYVIIPDAQGDAQSYKREISDMSGLPESILERLEGCGNLSKAITLGHEMSHFGMGPTLSNAPARNVEIESFCDAMPLIAFQKVSDPKSFEATRREMILARAISPIPEAIEIRKKQIHLKFPDSIYGHATALLLDNNDLLSQDDPGQCVIDAYKSAVDAIAPNIEQFGNMPSIFACYCASKDVLADNKLQDPNARRVLELYVEGIEYFSPTYAAKSLEITAAERKPKPVQNKAGAEVSLELS